MHEMASEEFYSLYMDVDNQEMGIFNPLRSNPSSQK